MSGPRRLAVFLGACALVAVAVVALDYTYGPGAPLRAVQSSPALELLPADSVVVNRVVQHRAYSFDGSAPAAVRVNAQSTLAGYQVRDYYRDQLMRLGFKPSAVVMLPVDTLLDVYVRGPLRAEVSIDTAPGSYLRSGERTAFQYALTD